MVAFASAQFQMFEHLFNQGGQQQQQQRQQNVASDSDWYQRTYDGGKLNHVHYVISGCASVVSISAFPKCWCLSEEG